MDDKAFLDLKAAWPLDWRQRRRARDGQARYRNGALVVVVSCLGRLWLAHVVVNRRRASRVFDARSPAGIRTKVCRWAAAFAPLVSVGADHDAR